MHEIHLTVCGFDASERRLDLETMRQGIEFARRRMSLIETPEPYVPPFGEALIQQMDEKLPPGVDRHPFVEDQSEIPISSHTAKQMMRMKDCDSVTIRSPNRAEPSSNMESRSLMGATTWRQKTGQVSVSSLLENMPLAT